MEKTKYKVIAPNKSYNDISASVPFFNGVGYTDSEYLKKWFLDHGYEVVEEGKTPNNENGDEDKVDKKELINKCKELGIPVDKKDTVESLKTKIEALNNENGEAHE